MATKNANEMLAEDIRVLGSEYGTAFYHCKQELWRVSFGWDLYETLFSTKTKVQILNECNGEFWGAIQNTMFESTALGICRLTDPSRNRAQRNLSVETLFELDPSRHKKRLEKRVAAARSASEFARTWRDKRIAHNDFDQLTGQANMLARATRNRVTAAIVAIHEVLRWIDARYFDRHLSLVDLGGPYANSVLVTLAEGNECRRRMLEEWESGTYPGHYAFEHPWLHGNRNPDGRYERRTRLKLPRTVKKDA